MSELFFLFPSLHTNVEMYFFPHYIPNHSNPDGFTSKMLGISFSSTRFDRLRV